MICIWQPAAVRRERRLGPWLCDTGFRLLCLFLYSCSSASRTDIWVCQNFMFTVYQICPKMQGDFQKIYKILTELIPRRKDGGREYLPPSFGYHAWNKVNVSGNWYQIDMTYAVTKRVINETTFAGCVSPLTYSQQSDTLAVSAVA